MATADSLAVFAPRPAVPSRGDPPPGDPWIPKATYLGVGVSVVGHEEVIRFITATARSRGKALVNNVNAHAMHLAHRDGRFAAVLDASQVVFCDGVGVKALARLAGVRLGERMTPREWIDDLFDCCARDRLSCYFLGCEEGVARAFAAEAARRHPRLRVAGVHHGFFDLDGDDACAVARAINDSGADIVLAGMGMPRQEIWAHGVLPQLDRGVLVAVGALFKMYTGMERTCPRWVGRCGFEWLWRFAHEPARLGRRYLVGNTALVLRTLHGSVAGWRRARARQPAGREDAARAFARLDPHGPF